MQIKTPYYLIDESRILDKLKIISKVKEVSGAKVLLALKCFSSWSVFPLLKKYLDGTTSSSVYEARLGYEEFGKETQGYCVGYTEEEIKEINRYADTVIFNSVNQLKRLHTIVAEKKIGLRVNPHLSYSKYDLADPNRAFSKCGAQLYDLREALPYISGMMFHFNCDNENFENFKDSLDKISLDFSAELKKVQWVSLGGGVLFTEKTYPHMKFAKLLKSFATEHGVQIYLEPGEAIIHNAGELVTSVVDIMYNMEHIAIVDAATEPHMLDLVIYRLSPKLEGVRRGKYTYHIAGRSCLAGDVFGTYDFNKPLKIGDQLRIGNALGYSIVKKTWFNGLQQPSIVVKRLNGKMDVGKIFTYRDYKANLS